MLCQGCVVLTFICNYINFGLTLTQLNRGEIKMRNVVVAKGLKVEILDYKKDLNTKHSGLKATAKDLASNWVIKGIKKNRFKPHLIVKVKDNIIPSETYGILVLNDDAEEVLFDAIEKAQKKYKIKYISICDFVSVLCRIGMNEGIKIKTKVIG